MTKSIDDIATIMGNAVQALNKIATTFPRITGASTSATGGALALPANPVGFIIVITSSGASVKIPYYT